MPAIEYPPTSAAFVCKSDEEWNLAVRVFSNKWTQRKKEHGPWDPWAIRSLNNWIASLIKLKRFAEAEGLCNKILNEMIESGLKMSPQYCCVLCNLATCLFLSGQYEAAENWYVQIRSRPAFYAYPPAQDFFEVMLATFETKHDCVVLRDSRDGLNDLRAVEDYQACHRTTNATIDNLTDGPQQIMNSPMGRFGAISLGLGSLSRKVSLSHKLSITRHNPALSASSAIQYSTEGGHMDVRSMHSRAEIRPFPSYDSTTLNQSDVSQLPLRSPTSAIGFSTNESHGYNADARQNAVTNMLARTHDLRPLITPSMAKQHHDEQGHDWPTPAAAPKQSFRAHASKGRNISVDTTRSSVSSPTFFHVLLS
jgi:hypothetical protein